MNKPKKITVGHYKGGILSLFNSNMKRLPDDSTEKIFSFKRVVFYILIIGVLFVLDMLAQTWFVVSNHNITWDPWWLGIFGVNTCGSNINLASIFAMIFGLSMGFGILVGLAGLIIQWRRGIFLTAMVMIIGGIARAFGIGLGKMILYMQIKNGQIAENIVMDGCNHAYLDNMDSIVPAWPIIIAAIIFTIFVLVLALIRDDNHFKVKIGCSSSLVSFIGLMGIIMVESGFAPTRLILVLAIAFISFVYLPKEVGFVRLLDQNRISAKWEWHAASIIWLEAIFVCAMIIVTILDI